MRAGCRPGPEAQDVSAGRDYRNNTAISAYLETVQDLARPLCCVHTHSASLHPGV